MQNTTYVGISRLNALARQMDVVANNIANASTTAYKGERLMFSDYVTRVRGPKADSIAFVQDEASLQNFEAGPLVPTGNDLDIAIDGDGFFTVSAPQGERYTRDGKFRLGVNNQLVTADGYLVLDRRREPVILPDRRDNITILKNGKIVVDGVEIAELGVAKFSNNHNLRKTQHGYYSHAGQLPELEPLDKGNTSLRQGMVEGSNINPILEMARMIDVHRAFESANKLLEAENERMRKAMQVYGRTQS